MSTELFVVVKASTGEPVWAGVTDPEAAEAAGVRCAVNYGNVNLLSGVDLDLHRAGRPGNLVAIARGLVSEEGENPEYDRGVTEVVCEAMGMSMDDKVAMAATLGVKARAVSSWGAKA